MCFFLLLCATLTCQHVNADLDFSYNNTINFLTEEINYNSDLCERAFYVDCKEMIESKYPIQTQKRENALKFIETTRIW